MPITTRAAKGYALTHAEMDANLAAVQALVKGAWKTTMARKLAQFTPRPLDRQGYCLAPPDWAAGTYTNGMAVKNGGQVFLALGTFTSSAAPSTISSLPVADPGDGTTGPTNSKGWVYWGPLNVVASDVVSYAAQAGTPSLTDVGGTFAYLAARGISDPAVISYFNNAGAALPYSGSYNVSGNRCASNGGWSFVTDEPVIAWRTPGYDVPVFVDDVRVNIGVLGSAAAGYKVLTFSGRRMREIRIEWGSSSPTNFYLGTNPLMLPSAKKGIFSWLAVGDSYFDGAAPGPALFESTWPRALGAELGLPPPVRSAVGSTGWLNASSTTNFLQRLQLDQAAHTAKNYDMIVIQGSGNDTSQNLVALAAQYSAGLVLLRSISPTAPIIVMGIVNGDFTTSGAASAYNTALSTAVATFAATDGNAYYIPASVDMPGGIPLLNANNAANYIGPTDRHPFDSGHLYLGRYFANAIRGLFLS